VEEELGRYPPGLGLAFTGPTLLGFEGAPWSRKQTMLFTGVWLPGVPRRWNRCPIPCSGLIFLSQLAAGLAVMYRRGRYSCTNLWRSWFTLPDPEGLQGCQKNSNYHLKTQVSTQISFMSLTRGTNVPQSRIQSNVLTCDIPGGDIKEGQSGHENNKN
jgi:hypothetical protein